MWPPALVLVAIPSQQRWGALSVGAQQGRAGKGAPFLVQTVNTALEKARLWLWLLSRAFGNRGLG